MPAVSDDRVQAGGLVVHPVERGAVRDATDEVQVSDVEEFDVPPLRRGAGLEDEAAAPQVVEGHVLDDGVDEADDLDGVAADGDGAVLGVAGGLEPATGDADLPGAVELPRLDPRLVEVVTVGVAVQWDLQGSFGVQDVAG